MYDEYNMQTASGTAESDVSGVFMNMVTKSGGNRFASDHNFYFMNESMQADNLDDDLRARLGLQPGQQTGAAGNPIDISSDWSSTIGGPIRRDKAWFFGAIRWWRLDQFQIGAFNPDGSQAIDDNRIRNFMGKGTWQVRQGAKASFLLNKNINDRFHRRNAPYLIVEDKATGLQEQPAQNYLAQWNQVIGSHGILDARFGRMWGIFPFRFQKDVRPTDIAISRPGETDAHQLRRDAVGQSQPSLPGGHQRQLLSPERTDRYARRQGRRAILTGTCAIPSHPERRLLPGAARRRASPGGVVEHADRFGPSPEHVGRVPAGSLGDRARHDQCRSADGWRRRVFARAVQSRRCICR